MSQAQCFLHTDSAGGYSPPTFTPARMDFYALQECFWQLEAEQPFSPAAHKFYGYWLNRFNKDNGPQDRWPRTLRRFTKQVAADMSMDEKTIYKLIIELQTRGLLRYTAGTRSQSATWEICTSTTLFAADDRNNSSRQPSRTSRDDRNNSTPNGNDRPRTSHHDRKNSSPYKEEDNTSSVVEKEDKTNAADAAAPAIEKLATERQAPTPTEKGANPESPDAQAPQAGGAALLFPAWATDTFRAAWAEWLTFRQSKRDKLKPPSQQKMLDKLAGFDEGFCHLLFDKAISNGYTGLVFDDTPAKYELYKRNQSTPYDPAGNGNQARTGHKSETLADLVNAVNQYFALKYGH